MNNCVVFTTSIDNCLITVRFNARACCRRRIHGVVMLVPIFDRQFTVAAPETR